MEEITAKIEFVNISKKYPDGREIFNGFNLSVEENNTTFICGKTNSGKTTLRRLLMKCEEPDSGFIYVHVGRPSDNNDTDDGSDSGEKADGLVYELSHVRRGKLWKHRRRIGAVYGETRLLRNRTLYENIVFVLKAVGRQKNVIDEMADALLKHTGLSDYRNYRPGELDPEYRVRADIARALASDPEIIVADEPNVMLDNAAGIKIIRLLITLGKKLGKTVVILMREDTVLLSQFRKRIVTLDGGKIVGDIPDISGDRDGFDPDADYEYSEEIGNEIKEDTGAV